MAEQSVSPPVTLRSKKPAGGNSRRHSTGKATSGNDEKNLPHYLRASTGSCHDFCKYGTKHAFEDTTRCPSLRRKAKKLADEQNSTDFQQERNEVGKVAQKPSSAIKFPQNVTEIIKHEVPKKPVGRKSPMSNVIADEKNSSGQLLTKSADMQTRVLRQILAKNKTMANDSLTESVDSQISASSGKWAESRKISLREKNKASVTNLKSSTDSKICSSTKFTKPGVASSSEKLEASLKQISSKPKEAKVSARQAYSLKTKSSSPDSSRILTAQGNCKNMIGPKTSTSNIAIKPVQVSPRTFLSPKTSSSGIARGVSSPKASLSLKPTVQIQVSPRVSLTPKPSLSRVSSLNARKHGGSVVASPMKNESKITRANNVHPKTKRANPDQYPEELKGTNSVAIQEKTLYVIKMDTGNRSLESDRNENISIESSAPSPPPPPPLPSTNSPALTDSLLLSSDSEEVEEESEYTETDAEDDWSEYDEIDSMEEPDPVEGEQKGWRRKAGMMPPQDKNDQPVKLRFRRGKVIDVKAENNTPRRLRFRQGRLLGENQNLKADARRSFRRGAEELIEDNNLDSEQVVLRHQDVHGKKDAQGLFNNVIEETASKLAETRKSKVKALVGAFETVISLQDSKSPVHIAS